MLFNSIPFLIFFPIVIAFYYILSHSYRWVWLLLASCFFYMFFKPEYILILFFTIIIDYFAGIQIENSKNKNQKKYWLIASLIANIGILAIFKYYNFINDNITGIAKLAHYTNPIPALKILLPIGLSFHTFQAMSYTIEVYKGRQQAERHFGYYALYVMFFPQLVAGPIERPQNILHQLKEKKLFHYQNFSDGGKLMLWGFFKKICIADRLAFFVNEVYKSPADHTGFQCLIAIVFFSFQIYCDFSAYTDIAIGSAKVMGIDLMKNFDRPYASTSIATFWKRWHISLSTWFRDYLYIPLGGNRKGAYITYLNIMIVFLLSGLWHGASWTFVIWGAIHGIAVVFETRWIQIKKQVLQIDTEKKHFLLNYINIVFVFIVVSIAWIFFRAENLNTIHILFKQIKHIEWSQFTLSSFGAINRTNLILSFIVIILLEGIQYITKEKGIVAYLTEKPAITRWSIYFILIFSMLLFGAFHESKEFIYFQF